jgi:hypothetical protein
MPKALRANSVSKSPPQTSWATGSVSMRQAKRNARKVSDWLASRSVSTPVTDASASPWNSKRCATK